MNSLLQAVLVFSFLANSVTAKIGVVPRENRQVAENAKPVSRMLADTMVYSASSITEAEVIAAQSGWCAALLSIRATHVKEGHKGSTPLAQAILDAAYGYSLGVPVLFKPTLAYGDTTFRLTSDSALCYFVGGCPDTYPNDTGFALKPWAECESMPAGFLLLGDVALSMGNVKFTDKSGAVTVVDKTWGYKKDDAGALRIILHHSSLPHAPGK
jgi:hypothetical protein